MEDIATRPESYAPNPALDALDAATAPAANGNVPEIVKHMKPSGLRQHYVVEMDDGRFMECHTNGADVLRYEKTFRKGWFDEGGVSFGRLLFIAWAALRRVKVPGVEDNFQEFCEHVIDLHLDDQEGAGDAAGDVDPTLATRGDGSSYV